MEELSFLGPAPDAGALQRQWHGMLKDARDIVASLPPDEVGRCVLRADGALYRDTVERLRGDLASGAVRFHAGSIRGAFPTVRPGPPAQ